MTAMEESAREVAFTNELGNYIVVRVDGPKRLPICDDGTEFVCIHISSQESDSENQITVKEAEVLLSCLGNAMARRTDTPPSALSGDAGEGERLEHARAALQRVRDRFTNICNSSPLWCDMAEDMDAYAAEGLDRSKARG